ncbi:MAG: hypothetical protein CYPHOPRED_004819 [Cyphobasidiales sp. Tagirdzhanova-0007]|nr:MAG: hypothetical protein CYPHOPRED_004819 [Cyphobasidiales sp. Tagirdzhanova-0007]
MKTIIVNHLTKNVTEKHVEEIFGAYGEVKKVEMPINRRVNAHRGSAIVVYLSTSDASKAVAYMDRGQLDGMTTEIEIAEKLDGIETETETETDQGSQYAKETGIDP